MDSMNLYVVILLLTYFQITPSDSQQQLSDTCKINNIALVVDSTALVSNNELQDHFTKMTTILYKTVIGLYDHAASNARVSGRVYHTNTKCGEELTYEEGEYFDPVQGVDAIFQALVMGGGVSYHNSRAPLNVLCAEWLLFSQYDLFDVCDDVGVLGFLIYMQTDGLYIDVYVNKYQVIHHNLANYSMALVYDSTSSLNPPLFQLQKDRTKEMMASFLRVYELNSTVLALVYHNNTNCGSIKLTQDQYLPPTTGYEDIVKALDNLTFHDSMFNYNRQCAKENLFSLYTSFSGKKRAQGIVGMTWDTNPMGIPSAVYLNKQLVMRSDRWSGVEKWIVELLCAEIVGVQYPTEFQNVKSWVKTMKASVLYAKKDKVLRHLNDMLKVSGARREEDAELANKYPKCIVETIDQFCVKLGRHLTAEQTDTINMRASEIGIDISTHGKTNVLVAPGWDAEAGKVTVYTESLNSSGRSESAARSVLLPARLFDQAENVIYTSVYRILTDEVDIARFNISVVFYRKTSFSLRSNNGRVAIRMPQSSSSSLSPIKLNFRFNIPIET